MVKDGFAKKVVKKMACNTATKSANRICTLFVYQPKLPESVKKLRKF